jgi:thiosulfate/3-mercaptopyruvate sulfurtransferase
VLDGGLPAWQDVDDAVETGIFEAPSGGDAYQGMPNPDLLAQLDEVMESLEDPDVVLLDARTPEEYAKGHIPGAVNLNFPLNASPEPPKFWKPADELQTMYDDVGAAPEKMVIPYCASGVRSAVTAFTLHLLGYKNVALYTGSWLEWGENPDTPKAEGNKP